MTELTSRQKGKIVEFRVAADLIEYCGYDVSFPVTDCRYDLLFEDHEGQIFKVQCKIGNLKKGTILFSPCSVNNKTQIKEGYRGQADYFGVYCPDVDECFLVPVDRVPITGYATLRWDPVKRQSLEKIRWAKDYFIKDYYRGIA